MHLITIFFVCTTSLLIHALVAFRRAISVLWWIWTRSRAWTWFVFRWGTISVEERCLSRFVTFWKLFNLPWSGVSARLGTRTRITFWVGPRSRSGISISLYWTWAGLGFWSITFAWFAGRKNIFISFFFLHIRIKKASSIFSFSEALKNRFDFFF